MVRILRQLAVCTGVVLAAWSLQVAAADEPHLQSQSALVIDEQTGEVLYGKNADAVVPIASITKLMTAIVTLDLVHDEGASLQEPITVGEADAEATKGQRSRLRVGTTLTREDLLRLALMSSENRAAAALGHSYPGGMPAFVEAMNAKAALLAMHGSQFVEPTGLSSQNVSTAEDLVKLVRTAHGYPLIREFTTTPSYEVEINGRATSFVNTNGLVRSGNWEIGLSKTGFIRAAGRCLVMQAKLAARPVIIVLLDSMGTLTRIADAARIRAWLEPGYSAPSLNARAVKRAKAPARAAANGSSGRVNVQIPSPQVR